MFVVSLDSNIKFTILCLYSYGAIKAVGVGILKENKGLQISYSIELGTTKILFFKVLCYLTMLHFRHQNVRKLQIPIWNNLQSV